MAHCEILFKILFFLFTFKNKHKCWLFRSRIIHSWKMKTWSVNIKMSTQLLESPFHWVLLVLVLICPVVVVSVSCPQEDAYLTFLICQFHHFQQLLNIIYCSEKRELLRFKQIVWAGNVAGRPKWLFWSLIRVCHHFPHIELPVTHFPLGLWEHFVSVEGALISMLFHLWLHWPPP